MYNLKISIIIPVYNSENTIERAIISAIDQDYTNKEIIVINDGSFDNTRIIIEKYKKVTKQINTEHLGVSHARNVGISNSRGDYILFLDSDDYLLPNSLSAMIKNVYDCDILCGSYEIKNKYYSRRCIFDSSEMNQEQFIKEVCKVGSNYDYMYVWGKLFKRKVLSQNTFPEGIKMGEDVVAIIRAALKSKKIKTTNKIVYVYDKKESVATKAIFSDDYLNLYKVWDLIKMEFEKTNKDYLSYAEINIRRLDYTILARLFLSDKKTREKYISLIINANKRLKNNYKNLLKSGIVVSRKIIIVMVMVVSDIYIKLKSLKCC